MHKQSYVFVQLASHLDRNSYCLVAIVHHKMKLETSVYNALQVLGISLTDTTPLEDLFNKSNLNIDKELDGFYEPTLFDY